MSNVIKGKVTCPHSTSEVCEKCRAAPLQPVHTCKHGKPGDDCVECYPHGYGKPDFAYAPPAPADTREFKSVPQPKFITCPDCDALRAKVAELERLHDQWKDMSATWEDAAKTMQMDRNNWRDIAEKARARITEVEEAWKDTWAREHRFYEIERHKADQLQARVHELEADSMACPACGEEFMASDLRRMGCEVAQIRAERDQLQARVQAAEENETRMAFTVQGLEKRVQRLTAALEHIAFTEDGRPIVGISNRNAVTNFNRVLGIARAQAGGEMSCAYPSCMMGGGGCEHEEECRREEQEQWRQTEEKRQLDLEEQRLRIALMKRQLAEPAPGEDGR